MNVLELFRRLHADGQAILDREVADAADGIVTMRDGRIDVDVPGHTRLGVIRPDLQERR